MIKVKSRGDSAVAIWLFTGVVMLLIQVILGGVTRLTGSGLSITEWKVLEGALPPLNAQQWADAFARYRHTPQYLLLNQDFTLHDYKFIYFWEWFHREWARLISVVFLAGFVYLLAKKYLRSSMIKPLVILFLLGGIQGAIGWIMVKSGLTDDMVYVKPLKLALHFVFALVLVCYTWWFALRLSVPRTQPVASPRIHRFTWLLLAVLFFQLVYGALMAGHKAAPAAATWPLINQSWIPGHLFSPAINLLENKITVHFVHRSLAYILLALTIAWTVMVARLPFVSAYLRKTKWLPLGLLLIQVLLGISTVLSSPGIVANHWVAFDWLAELHQITGILYLLTIVLMLFLIRQKTIAQLPV